MLKCRDLVKEADRLLDGDLPWHRQLSVRFHLLICHNCRHYVQRLRMLLKAIPYMHRRATDQEVTEVMNRLDSNNHD